MMIPSLLGRRFQVDFVRPRASAAPVGWLLLAVGVLSVAASLGDFAPRWIEREQLHQQQADLRARIDRIAGTARPAAGSRDAIGLAQARGLLEHVDRPWAGLLDQLESTYAPQVHLVQLGVDPRFQTLLLQAEAPSLELLLRYSRELPGKGPVRAVRLTHDEWRSAPSGRIVLVDLTADLVRPAPAGEEGAR